MRLILEVWRYPYCSWLLHWHWGAYFPNASEVTLNDTGEIRPFANDNKAQTNCKACLSLDSRDSTYNENFINGNVYFDYVAAY